MLRRFLFIVAGLLIQPPVGTLVAESGGKPSLSMIEYQHEDYFRHPKMEEEDHLNGREFQFEPGLEIITDVDGAKIDFSGERIGTTPWEKDNLKPGFYQVGLEKTGYERLAFQVSIRSDRRTVVVLVMNKSTGTLKMSSLPPRAIATIDRIPLDGFEIDVAPGNHSLMVSAFGWETVRTNVHIPLGGRTEWVYKGKKSPFHFKTFSIQPHILPPDDQKGFLIRWTASARGNAEIRIFRPEGLLEAVIPFSVSASKGTIQWIPAKNPSALPEGTYRVIVEGTGLDAVSSVRESSFQLDGRFKRNARPAFASFSGLLYTPGTSMLPVGTWQVSTGIGIDINDRLPVNIGIRFSPASRLEFSGNLIITPRIPFDETSIGMIFSAAWKMWPKGGPFTVNLALSFGYEGFAKNYARIPSMNPGVLLPGIQFVVPMGYALGNWNFILSPALSLFFPGEDAGDWRFAGPARLTESLGAGVYYENHHMLLGISALLRGSDYPQGFVKITLWSGIEGRFALPGNASYVAIYTGVRILDTNPVPGMGIEFGILH